MRHSVREDRQTADFVEEPGMLINDFSRFYILLLLYEGPKHGYEIISKMESRLGQKVSPSLVYPFLKILESNNLVTFEEKSSGKRARNIYSLSTRGKTLCNRLFKQFTSVVSSAIEPSMQVCAHCGCQVFKDGYSETIRGKRLAFCCKYCATSYKKELGV